MSGVDEAAIARALAGWTPERQQARDGAMVAAQKLVSAKLGKLEREDFEALFQLLHTDHRDGGPTHERFSRAFVGSLAHKLLNRLPALNLWTERLWTARDDEEVAIVLDAFWEHSRAQLPGAGRSYPTVLLHARGPELYWPYFGDRIPRAYTALSGQTMKGRSGRDYIEYVRWVRDWRVRHDVPAHAVDLVLSVLGAPETTEVADASPQQQEQSPRSQPSAPAVNQLVLEVRQLGPRTCVVRLAGAESWPEDGAVLPPPSALHDHDGYASAAKLEGLGLQLFKVLFRDPAIAARYQDLRRAAEAPGTSPLRLVLAMCPDAEDPDQCTIAETCWELLVDPHRGPLSIDRQLRLVRTYSRQEPLSKTPAPIADRALRLRVGLANPEDQARLDIADEWAGFQELAQETVGSGALDLRVQSRLDAKKLETLLEDADVFHFAGHGREGGLILEGPGRKSIHLDSVSLRAMLGNQAPRVVVLNACQGSVAGATWPSVAEVFASRGTAAVVAMNGFLSDRSARLFAEELHQRLAAGVDVEAAVQLARWRAFAEGAPSWFMPVLWSRCGESFALLVPGRADADAIMRERVAELDARVEVLEPRMQVLRRLGDKVADAGHRRELADALLAEVQPDAASQAELQRLLADDDEIGRRVDELRRRDAEPGAAFREVASTLQRDLVPQLGAAAQTLPGLIDALRAVLERASPPAGVATLPEQPPESTLPDLPFAAGEPLRVPAVYEEVDGERRQVAEDRRIEVLVAQILERSKLLMDPAIVRRCVVHLLAGRHLVLTGPPGTGKSTLAQHLAQAFGYGSEMVTANPDWTTHDTIGGIAPVSERDGQGRPHLSYPFVPGRVLAAVEANWIREGETLVPRGPDNAGRWLIIDEMNRAPLDQAFGELFTALVDQRLRDPRRREPVLIPADFRLLCTANTADRRLLFEFSEALKRRFAFVAIPAVYGGGSEETRAKDRAAILAQLKTRPTLAGIADLDANFATVIDEVEAVAQRIRLLYPLGMAQVLDVLTFVLVGVHYDAADSEALLAEALLDNLGPLLESQSPVLLEALAEMLDGRAGPWCEAFVQSHAGYRPEPARARIAAVLAGLAGKEGPWGPETHWAEVLDKATRTQIDDVLPPKSSAGELAAALRRLAEERRG